MKTALSLTDSQVYTLRRLNSGTRYLMRGDGKKADEQRPDGPRSHRPVNAPSIPVLYRLGLVGFVTPPKAGQATSWHRVVITSKGQDVVKVAKTKAERGL
ncbi:TPA: hypothetical protein O3J34_004281 [Salmonella enterica subsp. enterica serovar Saintpaul str. CFSAN004154]|nr:hypothetical protein [Salmonella enterica subsp. enterica serovar Saintpaul str. CFSAN004154]